MVHEDDKDAKTNTQDGMLDSFSRNRNIVFSRALGSVVGSVCLGALYLLIPTLDKIVASWSQIRMAEVDCVRCNTQLNFCSSDLKQCRADALECTK